MKTITEAIVKVVAEQLMENDGGMSTTTREVKDELRKQGYWATQDQVSTLMNSLVENEPFWLVEYLPGTSYKTYTLTSPNGFYNPTPAPGATTDDDN